MDLVFVVLSHGRVKNGVVARIWEGPGKVGPMDIGTILFYLIVGTIVGLVGKFFAPGDKDNIPLWLTIVCGIGGMLVGGVIYRAFGGNGSNGLDWTQGFVTVLTAVVLVMIASAITGRRHSSV
jgi:uncharacterized membrane protein YeaQ/YmgE (transglycosylase-associated protein family)